jgi:DNA invertase Pin-like site-specific DNA recombinase
VWIYARDSGGPNQTESVAQQEQELIKFCKRHNLRPLRVFRDVARSGGSTVKRDDFMAMIDESESESRRPDGLLIWNYARFSRDYNDFQFYKSTLQRRGIIVHSLTDSIPVDDFAARVMETIISLANEEKRRQTSRDVKRGLKELTEKRFAPGIPPKGYKSVPVCIGENRNGIPHYVSRWEPDPVLSEYVKLAFELRAAGKSYAEITKATKGKLYTAAGSWVTFFKNKSYLGIYGKREIKTITNL